MSLNAQWLNHLVTGWRHVCIRVLHIYIFLLVTKMISVRLGPEGSKKDTVVLHCLLEPSPSKFQRCFEISLSWGPSWIFCFSFQSPRQHHKSQMLDSALFAKPTFSVSKSPKKDKNNNVKNIKCLQKHSIKSSSLVSVSKTIRALDVILFIRLKVYQSRFCR